MFETWMDRGNLWRLKWISKFCFIQRTHKLVLQWYNRYVSSWDFGKKAWKKKKRKTLNLGKQAGGYEKDSQIHRHPEVTLALWFPGAWLVCSKIHWFNLIIESTKEKKQLNNWKMKKPEVSFAFNFFYLLMQ